MSHLLLPVIQNEITFKVSARLDTSKSHWKIFLILGDDSTAKIRFKFFVSKPNVQKCFKMGEILFAWNMNLLFFKTTGCILYIKVPFDISCTSIQLLTARMKSASSTSSKKMFQYQFFPNAIKNPQGTDAIRWWSLFTFLDLSTVTQTCYGVVFDIRSALSWLCCTQIAASDRSHFMKKKLYHIAIFRSQKTVFSSIYFKNL